MSDLPPQDVREFEGRLEAAVREEERRGAPTVDLNGKKLVWAPQPGAQEAFMSCPLFEVLMHGNRGGGKSDAFLMDFAQHVGRGFGAAWRGVIFRESYPQLSEIVAKSIRWFRQIFPGARFTIQPPTWTFETGEVLMFRHMRVEQDYWTWHGHELPWQGWEELTNWSDDRCYKLMMSCCRSADSRVPRKIRSTTNPYGVGHQWIKQRFRLGGAAWQGTKVVRDSTNERGELEPARASIPSRLSENRVLLDADPDYRQRMLAAATSSSMAEAWDTGSWDIVAGGMFADIWDPHVNELPEFRLPHGWKLDRSMDWGSSRPFSVGWWLESPGEDLLLPDGRWLPTVRGDLVRFREWYGCTGKPDEGLHMLASDVARGIVEREIAWGLRGGGYHVLPGPADSAIFVEDGVTSQAAAMQAPVTLDGRRYPGVTWTPADKRAGSRIAGWEEMRKRIMDAKPVNGERRGPGLFVVRRRCPDFLRTVLALPRDEKKQDDVDTRSEDHVGDEVRYRVWSKIPAASGGSVEGMY